MKAMIPIAVICAILVVADVVLNDGAVIRALHREFVELGRAAQNQILRLVD
jgi:pyrimidine operon attenuation protein/uracil phosphoribosyltransferase